MQRTQKKTHRFSGPSSIPDNWRNPPSEFENIKRLQKNIYRILKAVKDTEPIRTSRLSAKTHMNKSKTPGRGLGFGYGNNDTFNPFLSVDDYNIFNLKIGPNNENVPESEQKNYVNFLTTVNEAITKVQDELISNEGEIVSFFPADKGAEEPEFLELYRNLFNKKVPEGENAADKTVTTD
jgi:hypothetical protein